jgi:hypothetical protein
MAKLLSFVPSTNPPNRNPAARAAEVVAFESRNDRVARTGFPATGEEKLRQYALERQRNDLREGADPPPDDSLL